MNILVNFKFFRDHFTSERGSENVFFRLQKLIALASKARGICTAAASKVTNQNRAYIFALINHLFKFSPCIRSQELLDEKHWTENRLKE